MEFVLFNIKSDQSIISCSTFSMSRIVCRDAAVSSVSDVQVSVTLESFQQRRDITALTIIYRLYYGECSENANLTCSFTSAYHSQRQSDAARAALRQTFQLLYLPHYNDMKHYFYSCESSYCTIKDPLNMKYLYVF